MGYKSPYMRFGNTRYERDIARLGWHDSNLRSKAYEDAVRTLAEVLGMHDASLNYIDNVCRYVTDRKNDIGPFWDDDAVLVQRYARHVLGDDEYDWLKSELAKRGEEWEELGGTPRLAWRARA